ncbi:nucleotidyltransferase domain-containing protein [Agromyces sp. LHK192]|uniref:nucleotidyltransferase domain-containing protein n=1 Tax=Agromyces sp. LHK192 TaxID=2498704 RepID=UPI000FD76FEE|nr:nucleotidyltransferase domain-containing protein [Agromyces sp. LHK192]
MPDLDDDRFLASVADRLGTLGGVEAVALGGSRAQGTAGSGSDWDLAVYYRGGFAPEELRAVGWPGEVSEIGGWGGGVFNGGAWLEIDGRRVDVHYRDLDEVDAEIERAGRGEFHIEPLMFHLAGIPSYLVVAELALNRIVRGDLPTPAYPDALRRSASTEWAGRAGLHLDYAIAAHAEHGRWTQAVGLLSVAAVESAHAIAAHDGTWVTNDKRLLDAAGLTGIHAAVIALDGTEATFRSAADELRATTAARLS